jgi:hypothetical protein
VKSPKNIPASVRQRLLNRAKNDKRPFNEILQYYAMERFLYRLSQSEHADRFILKGALMLRAWRSPEFVEDFLAPLTSLIAQGSNQPLKWSAPGPWS